MAAIAVYPFGFRWEEPAHRSFEVSQQLLLEGLRLTQHRLRFFGPPEFQVYRPEADTWVGNNLVSVLPAALVSAEQTFILRPWAERRIESSQKQLTDAEGKPKGTVRVEEVTYVAHLEVLHPSSGDKVIELSGEEKVDPFEESEDTGDPAPGLTRLLARLLKEVLSALEEQLALGPEPQPLLAQLGITPHSAVDYSDPTRPALRTALAERDDLEKELQLAARARAANPGLDEGLAARVAHCPGGLYVLSVEPGAKLQAGDCLLAVDDRPALPQILHRARLGASSFQIRVKRATGAELELIMP